MENVWLGDSSCFDLCRLQIGKHCTVTFGAGSKASHKAFDVRCMETILVNRAKSNYFQPSSGHSLGVTAAKTTIIVFTLFGLILLWPL